MATKGENPAYARHGVVSSYRTAPPQSEIGDLRASNSLHRIARDELVPKSAWMRTDQRALPQSLGGETSIDGPVNINLPISKRKSCDRDGWPDVENIVNEF